jgi:hypothetical protein
MEARTPPKPWRATGLALALLVGCTGHISGAGATTSGAGPSSGGGGAAGAPASVPVPTSQLPMGATGPINPGRVTAHRLNKVEYDNTIRDLVGLDLKPSSTFGFPDDTYIEGFDNNADALTASPLLLEQYEAAADAVVQAALDPAPANAAVRGRIITCDPAKAGEGPCATQILTAFATRAWRRPAAAAEITPYAALVPLAKSLGDAFEDGLRAALRAMLLSPKFLFRTEANPGAGKVAALSDYELASRLSYFLWSSMPDDQLFARAAAGALHAPDELARQVARMIQDPRSASLISNLAGEWLGSRELAVEQITLTDVSFDADLRAAMAREAELFLSELFTGTHAVDELVGARFTFVNQRLATHYGLPGAATLTSAFTRVTLPDDKRAGGVLTQANFLTVSSLRDRTSPTRRGKWLSENLLCVVVPPPPPMIPQLPAQDTTAPTSARARLLVHRMKGATCNACHQLIDPMGLGFEHYDAVGRWRDTDAGAAIDVTGQVPATGAAFDGAVDLAAQLQKDARLQACITRKLLTYALGRSLVMMPAAGDDLDDAAGVSDLVSRVGATGTLAQLLDAVAHSPAMTMRIGDVQP